MRMFCAPINVKSMNKVQTRDHFMQTSHDDSRSFTGIRKPRPAYNLSTFISTIIIPPQYFHVYFLRLDFSEVNE